MGNLKGLRLCGRATFMRGLVARAACGAIRDHGPAGMGKKSIVAMCLVFRSHSTQCPGVEGRGEDVE